MRDGRRAFTRCIDVVLVVEFLRGGELDGFIHSCIVNLLVLCGFRVV